MIVWRTLLALLLVLALPAPLPAEEPAPPVPQRTILFIGNSFTYGATSPVLRFHAELVTDLNGDGIGGVPALFKLLAMQAGLDYAVSLETAPGTPLSFHLKQKRAAIERPWDVVILQGYSLLDPAKPGDPTTHVQAAGDLARMFRKTNPRAEVHLVTTWARADQVYRAKDGHWFGKPLGTMTADLAAATARALAASRDLTASVPVGEAWQRAMAAGIADPDPYDGIAFGQVNLWGWDQYHASSEGYYLEALTIFGRVTGIDPRTLGEKERAADELGLSPAVIKALQQTAYEELALAPAKRR